MWFYQISKCKSKEIPITIRAVAPTKRHGFIVRSALVQQGILVYVPQKPSTGKKKAVSGL